MRPEIQGGQQWRIVTAASLGTIFEWYDFFVYGAVASLIAKLFFPTENATSGFLLALATFGAGFLVRPLGAGVFGHLGDLLGRKKTFLITIVLMGGATAAVGLLPTFEQIGVAAPILLVLCRLLQGLAIGGEYGGAAVYVAEHAPANRRGFYTGFIQASATAGFLLSLSVVIGTTAVIGEDAWASWGWRMPFLGSLILLALSVWIRFTLEESPIFQEMKRTGAGSKNPLKDAFSNAKRVKAMLVVMFGVAAGLTVIWYTAQLHVLYFLQKSLNLSELDAQIVVGLGAASCLIWPVLFGALSDRFGRRRLILIGYALTLILIFPLFHVIANGINPAMVRAISANPIVIKGDCSKAATAPSEGGNSCRQLREALAARGLAYRFVEVDGAAATLTIGARDITLSAPSALDESLRAAGYPLEKTSPSNWGILQAVLAISAVGILSGMTNGPVGALLVEMFPTKVRYTSLSLPYHIGSGYFGGFLPLLSQMIAAGSGSLFAGLWYMFAVVAVALATAFFWLPETLGRDLAE